MIETARAACAGGATVVQLRAPGWKKRQLVECGRALKTVLAPYHVPLIVDDDADVCLAVNADGLHVGQRDLAPEDARAIIGGDRILGLSVTTLAELTAADTTPIDYFGVGPVFATPRRMPNPPAGWMDFRRSPVRQGCRRWQSVASRPLMQPTSSPRARTALRSCPPSAGNPIPRRQPKSSLRSSKPRRQLRKTHTLLPHKGCF